MITRILFAAALAISFSPICAAQIIEFDNFAGRTISEGVSSDVSATIGGVAADDATLATTTQITGINWSGAYGGAVIPAADDNFEIRIYADAAAPAGSPSPRIPGALLQSFAVGNAVNRTTGDTGILIGQPAQYFDYAADINFTFDAGVTHWISIFNDTTASPTSSYFQAASEAIDGNLHLDTNENVFSPIDIGFQFQPSAQGGFATDFQLTSSEAIPEPGSLGLLALGLIGLATRRKR